MHILDHDVLIELDSDGFPDLLASGLPFGRHLPSRANNSERFLQRAAPAAGLLTAISRLSVCPMPFHKIPLPAVIKGIGRPTGKKALTYRACEVAYLDSLQQAIAPVATIESPHGAHVLDSLVGLAGNL